MERGPLIGILVPRRKSRIHVLDLYRSPPELNMQVCAFTPKGILWSRKQIIGVCQTKRGWKEKKLPFPDAVYNRIYTLRMKYAQAVGRVIGRKFFNAVTFFNKGIIFNALRESGVKSYLPATFIYDEAEVEGLLEEYKLLYVKPVYGNKGTDVYRIELAEHGDILISSHSLAPRYIVRPRQSVQAKLAEILSARRHFITQQGIRSSQIDDKYFELRVLVQKGFHGCWAITTIVGRVAYADYFNPSVLVSVQEAEVLLSQVEAAGKGIIRDLQTISLEVAHVLDHSLGLLGELSVDFILDTQGDLWIIEVNGKPQKEIYTQMKAFPHHDLIYQRPLEYAYFLAQQKGWTGRMP